MIYEYDNDGDDCWLEIATPTITSPVNGATGISIVVGLGVTVSVPVFQVPGLVLLATDIEIRTAAKGGGTLVYSSSTLTVPALTLALGTTYYIRVRHRTSLFSSMWSNDIQITTSLT